MDLKEKKQYGIKQLAVEKRGKTPWKGPKNGHSVDAKRKVAGRENQQGPAHFVQQQYQYKYSSPAGDSSEAGKLAPGRYNVTYPDTSSPPPPTRTSFFRRYSNKICIWTSGACILGALVACVIGGYLVFNGFKDYQVKSASSNNGTLSITTPQNDNRMIYMYPKSRSGLSPRIITPERLAALRDKARKDCAVHGHNATKPAPPAAQNVAEVEEDLHADLEDQPLFEEGNSTRLSFDEWKKMKGIDKTSEDNTTYTSNDEGTKARELSARSTPNVPQNPKNDQTPEKEAFRNLLMALLIALFGAILGVFGSLGLYSSIRKRKNNKEDKNKREMAPEFNLDLALSGGDSFYDCQSPSAVATNTAIIDRLSPRNYYGPPLEADEPEVVDLNRSMVYSSGFMPRRNNEERITYDSRTNQPVHMYGM